MNSTRLITVLLMTACLLAGWIVGSEGQVANAQDPVETVTETEALERDCHFEIPVGASLDGRPALLDQCTGETWRFDDGYDFASNTYSRPYSWVFVSRE